MVVKPDGTSPTIGLDFDGTIAHHAPTPPTLNPNGPIDGALDFVQWLLMKGYCVIVISARALTPSGEAGIVDWLKKYGFPPLPVTDQKLSVDLLLDDRALRFEGDYAKVRMFLNNHPCPGRWERP